MEGCPDGGACGVVALTVGEEQSCELFAYGRPDRRATALTGFEVTFGGEDVRNGDGADGALYGFEISLDCGEIR